MRENTYQHDRQVHIIQLGGERQTGRQKQTDRDRQADRITKGSNIILDIVMYIKINSKQICWLKDVENKCVKVLRFTDGVTRQQSSACIPIQKET